MILLSEEKNAGDLKNLNKKFFNRKIFFFIFKIPINKNIKNNILNAFKINTKSLDIIKLIITDMQKNKQLLNIGKSYYFVIFIS